MVSGLDCPCKLTSPRVISEDVRCTGKNPKNLDTQKSYCKKYYLISSHLVMDPQAADRMVNNVDIVCSDLSVQKLRNITVFVSFSFQFEWKFLHANSLDHDQTAQNAASDQDLNCFPKP